MVEIIGIKFKKGGKIYYFSPKKIKFETNEYAIVETARGVECGLVALANRMARKVAKTHHQIKLEPLTPNERRIIHTALQNDAYVTTFSKGTEPNRYLIIAPKH